MTTAAPKDVTGLLQAWSGGDETALEALIPLIYRELKKRARGYMARERPGHTLQTTALINEAFLRLAGSSPIAWESRNHFLAISALMMRRILVDHARSKRSERRGGQLRPVELDEEHLLADRPHRDLVSLDEALTALAKVDARKARVVELRGFGGLTVEEAAQVLKVNRKTVMRDWDFAKTWLLREMNRAESGAQGTARGPTS